MFNPSKLLSEMVLHAYEGGNVVYHHGVDKAVVELLPFNDLNTLSGLSPYASSFESKLLHTGGGIKHFTNSQEMMDRRVSSW